MAEYNLNNAVFLRTNRAQSDPSFVYVHALIVVIRSAPIVSGMQLKSCPRNLRSVSAAMRYNGGPRLFGEERNNDSSVERSEET